MRRLGILPQFFCSDNFVSESANSYIRANAGRWSENTITTYTYHLGQFLRWIEYNDLVLEVFDGCDMEIYTKFLCDQQADGKFLNWNTVDRRVHAIGQFLIWMAENNRITTPSESFRFSYASGRGTFRRNSHPRAPMHIPTRFVSLSAATSLVRILEADPTKHAVRNSLMARVMLEVGLRVSEVLSLDLETLPRQYSESASTIIRVIGKGRKQRLVLLPSHLLRDIHGYVEVERRKIAESFLRRHERLSPLFLGANGERISRGWVERIFRIASQKLGTRVTPHMLRHTFGTYHYNHYRDLASLAELMGHSSINTTSRYYVHASISHAYSKRYEEFLDLIDRTHEKNNST